MFVVYLLAMGRDGQRRGRGIIAQPRTTDKMKQARTPQRATPSVGP